MPQVKRWYTGFSYRGNPQDLINKISEQVHRQNLTKIIPLLRVEKGIKSRKPFYFFLAIDGCEVGELPTELQSSLLKLSFFESPIKDSRGFTYEQIKPMVGVGHDVYDYTSPIPYQPRQNLIAENPFELTELQSINHSDADWVKASQNSDRFLYWLSTLGNGSWESFKKSCNALQLQQPKRILRRLRLLGHLESSLDGSRWSVAPSAIVKINSQASEFILCGQRSLGLLRQLEEHGVVAYITHQTRGEAPSCIKLAVSNPDAIAKRCCEAQIANNFPIINAGEASKRFLALYHHGASCQVHYNIATKCLAIPLKQRWPELYERALVLASGQLPTYQGNWLLYQNVSEEVAHQLSQKLNVKYEEALICA